MTEKASISIHPTAIIDAAAEIASTVEIGPYCVIGGGCVIKDNTRLISHVCVSGETEIGENNIIYPFASIGSQPQDLKYHGEKSRVVIGNNNSIREYVTIHPGTEGGRMETTIGNNCLFMASSHVAHDCIVGDNVVMANCATLAGHVVCCDSVVIGGLSAVHQWVRIGRSAMIGGMCGVERDVIPFGVVQGNRAELIGLNLIGLKRHGASYAEVAKLKQLYDVLFLQDGLLQDKLSRISDENLVYDSERSLVGFMREESRRSYCLVGSKK